MYSCGRDGPITSFTTFHNVNCRHGFVFSTLSGQIKVSLGQLTSLAKGFRRPSGSILFQEPL